MTEREDLLTLPRDLIILTKRLKLLNIRRHPQMDVPTLEQPRVLPRRVELHAFLDGEDMVDLSVDFTVFVGRGTLFARVAPSEEELGEPAEVPEGVVCGDERDAVDVAPCLAELEAEGDVFG